MHPERLEVPMLKARVGGEGIRREREGSTVELVISKRRDQQAQAS